MWSKIKALPVVPKIVLGCLVLIVMAQVFLHVPPRPRPTPGPNPYDNSYDNDSDKRSRPEPSADNRGQLLAQFQDEQRQLQTVVADCMQQMTAATQQMAMNSMNGVMPGAGASCQQNMPQWTAREAFLETEIYRLQTGDTRSSVRQITGIAGPNYSSPTGSSSYYSPRDGTGAVETWDRQAIRGNSMYTDENGEEHELPTQNYYFRDRSSGQYIGSDLPDPPNDGRDYERLEPAPPPQ
ncbi:MAG TPA: hypothetical protein VMI10_05920 [Terriglobales bacterium]|nr:hypothetical protein [Terriglobales bacterium]